MHYYLDNRHRKKSDVLKICVWTCSTGRNSSKISGWFLEKQLNCVSPSSLQEVLDLAFSIMYDVEEYSLNFIAPSRTDVSVDLLWKHLSSVAITADFIFIFLFFSVSSVCGQMDSASSWVGRWAVRPCAASWKSSSLWRSSSASWTWRTSPSLTAPPWSPNLPATTTSATTSVRLSSRGQCAQMNECVNIHIHIYIYIYLCAAMHLLTVFNPDTPPPVSVLKHLHEKTLRTDTNTRQHWSVTFEPDDTDLMSTCSCLQLLFTIDNWHRTTPGSRNGTFNFPCLIFF